MKSLLETLRRFVRGRHHEPELVEEPAVPFSGPSEGLPAREVARLERRPRVVMSLDRTWNARMVSRFLLDRLIRRAGGVPYRVSYGTGPEPGHLDALADELMAGGDALLLTGGSDVDPALYDPGGPSKRVVRRRDDFELALVRAALARDLPILGICRGCQLLNVAHGGTLADIRQDERLRRIHFNLDPHDVHLLPDSHLARITGTSLLKGIRSLHGQVVREPGENLRVAATCPDGLIEAIEHVDPDRWIVGVQWHPELMFYVKAEHRIVDDLVRDAGASAAGQRPRSA